MRIALFFIVGVKANNTALQHQLEQEMRTHQDVLQGRFPDSYITIYQKMLFGYRWVAEHCPTSVFTIKSYDDIFINVYLVHQFLTQKFPELPHDTLACLDDGWAPPNCQLSYSGNSSENEK